MYAVLDVRRPLIVLVGEHIRDVDERPRQSDTSDQRPVIDRGRMRPLVFDLFGAPAR